MHLCFSLCFAVFLFVCRQEMDMEQVLCWLCAGVFWSLHRAWLGAEYGYHSRGLVP